MRPGQRYADGSEVSGLRVDPEVTPRAAGILQIERAEWKKDNFGTLWLKVNDREGHEIAVWLSLRPPYCDRGHIQCCIEGRIYLDHADSFPRFFFSFAEADQHVRTFLKWRLWEERCHPHTLEVA